MQSSFLQRLLSGLVFLTLFHFQSDGQFAIPLELANTISLFLACPTPMLSALITATTNFVATNGELPVTNTTDTLATIVQVSKKMNV